MPASPSPWTPIPTPSPLSPKKRLLRWRRFFFRIEGPSRPWRAGGGGGRVNRKSTHGPPYLIERTTGGLAFSPFTVSRSGRRCGVDQDARKVLLRPGSWSSGVGRFEQVSGGAESPSCGPLCPKMRPRSALSPRFGPHMRTKEGSLDLKNLENCRDYAVTIFGRPPLGLSLIHISEPTRP